MQYGELSKNAFSFQFQQVSSAHVLTIDFAASFCEHFTLLKFVVMEANNDLIEYLDEEGEVDQFHESDDESEDKRYDPTGDAESDEDEQTSEKRKKMPNVKGKAAKAKVATKVSSKKVTAIEEKLKLADLIEKEELIYNLNHKMHSNQHALASGWERVAKNMDKSGKYLSDNFF